MTPIAWMLCGGAVGMIAGAAVALIWAKEKIIAYHEDCENHRHAAMTFSRQIGVLARERDELKEQIAGLHRELEVDPSEAWKK